MVKVSWPFVVLACSPPLKMSMTATFAVAT